MTEKIVGKPLRQPQLKEADLQLIANQEDFLALLELAAYEESSIENC